MLNFPRTSIGSPMSPDLRLLSIGLLLVAGVFGASRALAAPDAPSGDERPKPSGSSSPQPSSPPASRAGVDVVIDKSKVDLKEHRLEVKMSHVASKVTIKVYDESGVVLADEEHDFTGRAAGSALVVEWSPSSDAAVARIEVFAYDEEGAYKGVAIVPWSVSIPHEEVNFRRDSADIDEPEKSKLEASLVKVNEALAAHRELGRI